jgi:hypothetical protein
MSSADVPKVISLTDEAATGESYDNHPIAEVNDHVVRIAVMTEPYHWHLQMLTVPKGVRHRTRPVGKRSVNITFESASNSSIPA